MKPIYSVELIYEYVDGTEDKELLTHGLTSKEQAEKVVKLYAERHGIRGLGKCETYARITRYEPTGQKEIFF